MNYNKISIKEELPQTGIFVTTIDSKNNRHKYCLNNDGSWRMLGTKGTKSENNNFEILYWLKPEYSQEEIDYLLSRGFKASGVDGSWYTKPTDNFRRCSIVLQPNGELHYSSHYPINVDCDDGSYDTEHCEMKFKSFDDFKLNNPYYNKTHY